MTAERVDVTEAALRIRSSDTLAVGLGPGHPGGFLHALGARDEWDDLQVFGALLTDLYEVFTRPGVHYRSGFFGPAERFLRDSGADIQYVPADFRRFAPIIEQLAPRVVATSAAAPDADGYCSLSLHAGATVDELHRCGADPARLLIVEHSEHFPHTYGLMPEHPHRLHLDEIDLIVETDSAPVDLEDPTADDIDAAIARIAVQYVPDGATIQTGIGAIPSIIATMLAEGPGSGYGIHSEMFTNGLMRLHRSGKVTNMGKGDYAGISITTFAAGTAELYRWLDHNTDVRFLPVDVVNRADIIAANHDFVSINGATAVDLYGQVAADTINGVQYSGTGGHEDFLAGAGLQSDDRSLLCLRSVVQTDDGPVSRISNDPAWHMIVTSPRHHVDVVITEHGAAELKGRTVRERAIALASIAHPDFRDELLDQAAKLG